MYTSYITDKEITALVDSIQTAESMTSGEIRVHIDSTTVRQNAKMAWDVFRSLNMDQTKERNGVLFHVNFEQKYLTIIGDEGIHQHVKQYFWDKLHDEITKAFAQKKYFEALRDAILKTGQELEKYFPTNGEHLNELPNEISFS
ncbi:TPM domain-containing protein [Soonwooa sp.]|uniref:TPM domain-containing protein n=1 Tax=Soonwooa sp. TaxID=1938592 RepID=UPI0026146C15|nr:TPM domain-containing protein [Soonwooa sp.]